MTSTLAVQVVDDHPLTARGLEDLLRATPIRFLETVEAVEDVSPLAEVVICDLILKRTGRSGSNAISYLADELGTPVVATSGYASDATIGSAIASGALSFIEKGSAGSIATMWVTALQAAGVRARTINAQLAKALLGDARRRPLAPDRDLDEVLKNYLRGILRDADAPLAMERRDWTSVQSRTHTDRIWVIAKRRHALYQPTISPVLREAAPLIRSGQTVKGAARTLNRSDRYLNKLLSELKASFHDSFVETGSPLLALEPKTLLLRLIEMEEETTHGSPGETMGEHP